MRPFGAVMIVLLGCLSRPRPYPIVSYSRRAELPPRAHRPLTGNPSRNGSLRMSPAHARDVCIRDDGYNTSVARSQTPFSAVVDRTRWRSAGWLLAICCVQCCASSTVRYTAAARVLCRIHAPLPVVLGPTGD